MNHPKAHYRNILLSTLILFGGLGWLLWQTSGQPTIAEVATTVEATEAEESAIVSETLIKSTRTWDGTLLPKYPEEQPEITVLKITIPAGVQLPTHKHPYINVGVLLEGELTVYTEDEDVLHLSAGDPIIELVDTWHYGVNEGEEPAVIFVVYAGVVGEPITVHKTSVDAGY